MLQMEEQQSCPALPLRAASAVYLASHHVNWSMILCVAIWAEVRTSLLEESQGFRPAVLRRVEVQVLNVLRKFQISTIHSLH
jgi:hypothetical protein